MFDTINQEANLYGGFWRRVGAWIIDGLVITGFSIGVGILVGAVVGFFGILGGVDPIRVGAFAHGLGGLIGVAIPFIYFTVLEGGPRQASFGKRALGVYIADDRGRKVSYARALGRYLCLIITGLTLGIGFMMCGWTARKRALQDMMMGMTVRRGQM